MGAFVQDDTLLVDDSSEASTIAKAFGSNTTSGNAIYVAAGTSGSIGSPSCSDSQSNTYTLKTNTYDATNGQSHIQFYAQNITGGACTVTVNFVDIHAYRRIYIGESSGGATTGLDAGGAAQVQAGSTGTDYYSSGDITTADAAFIWGAYQNINEAAVGTGTTTAGATPAYTIRENAGPSIMVGESIDSQAAGTFDANFTRSSGQRSITSIMAFKDAVGGGGTVTHLIGSSLLNSRLTRSILN